MPRRKMRTAPRSWRGAGTAALASGFPLEAVPSLTDSTKNGTYP